MNEVINYIGASEKGGEGQMEKQNLNTELIRRGAGGAGGGVHVLGDNRKLPFQVFLGLSQYREPGMKDRDRREICVFRLDL